MVSLLWLVPALPLLGFVLLFLGAERLKPPAVSVIGVGAPAISVLIALGIAGAFFAAPAEGGALRQVLWTWAGIAGFKVDVAFRLDALSLLMMLVITVVGFLIHLYSVEFMAGDPGYNRFFAYMNLFVAAMLVLVLADNLLLLYAGWVGVGLCSYLLIGFWYRDAANGAAARKAFVITRIGDTAMILGIILLYTALGTLEIAPLMAKARETWMPGSMVATAAAALLLGGALGKSAQLPLQTWLPDAMAGPTPVSALLHAATMVTAGVYLIARMHVLYALAPAVQFAVAVIGAVTLFIAAVSALNQHDLKRILAYSTMSQIGYMFLALGVGGATAAMFHFMTHACFKALLFLAAGAVMLRIADEHDIFRMGGLSRRLPLAFVSFLIGAASLAALPLITAGFYSKEMILSAVWTAETGGKVMWTAGFIAAFITAVYSFRAVFVVFFGPMRTQPTGRTGWRIAVPLIVLSVLALVAGFIETPAALGGVTAFARFLAPVLPINASAAEAPAIVALAASAAALLGVLVAYLVYFRRAPQDGALRTDSALRPLQDFWLAGWGFDRVYASVLVKPFVWLAHINRNDVIDVFFAGLALSSRMGHRFLSYTQNGRLRWYAAWLAAGALAAVAIVVFP
jgi:NADH-quinone oxidoreductase subunit L